MRPEVSYREDGRSARFADASRTDCPYAIGSLKLLEWQAGWLSGDLAIREEEEEDSDDLDRARYELGGIERSISDRYRHARSLGPALEEVEEVHGSAHGWTDGIELVESLLDSGLLERLEDDMGRCQPVRGLLRQRAGDGQEGHVWLEFENGMVMDALRWRIEGRQPAMTLDSIVLYDLGGLATRPMPEVQGLPVRKVSDAFSRMPQDFRGLLPEGHDEDGATLCRLAGSTLSKLGEMAPDLYAWLDREGLASLVPACNRSYVRHLLEWRERPLVETGLTFG